MMLTECLDSTAVTVVLAGVAGLLAGFVLGRISASPKKGRNRKTSEGSEQSFSGEGIELYVGNLSYDMSDPELEKIFSSYGKVLLVRIIKNKFNDRSKGYGFVEMADQNGADKAVKAMSGKEVMGRKMVVNEARSKSRE